MTMAVYIIINIILLAAFYNKLDNLGISFLMVLVLNALFIGVVLLFKGDTPSEPPKKKAEKPESVRRAEEEQNKKIAENMRNYYLNKWLFKINHRK